jgi:CheY-like chemotaxis protein
MSTVLVVDDDASILDTVSAILSGEGYDVVSAASGQEALDAVAREQPRVILLDMRMPIMDGWAVARALRSQGISVPIVVMTAAESAQRWADEVGAEGYLAKPFGLDELLATVERFRGPGGRAN